MFVVIAILLAVFVLPAPWGWVAVVLGIAVEVAETIIWMRLLRRHPTSVGSDALIGATARTVTACQPIGEVNVRGETWRARCNAGAAADAPVRIRARDGITLVVEPAGEPYPDPMGR